MKYLLDTHIFVWWITDNDRLKEIIRDKISEKNNEIFLSSASIWEIMIKSKLNKIQLPDYPGTFIKEQIALNAINILNITPEHAIETYVLPEIHKDPFDRMLIAQSKVENLTIITTDSFIKKYDVKIFC